MSNNHTRALDEAVQRLLLRAGGGRADPCTGVGDVMLFTALRISTVALDLKVAGAGEPALWVSRPGYRLSARSADRDIRGDGRRWRGA